MPSVLVIIIVRTRILVKNELELCQRMIFLSRAIYELSAPIYSHNSIGYNQISCTFFNPSGIYMIEFP
jgi:hypothetical protein